MKILVVEDDENNIALFQSELPAPPTCEPTFARSRDSALVALKADAFDLVVLDLKIPTQDGGLDSDINHGLAVHAHVQEISCGTPVIVFSAFGTVKLAARLAESSERHDVWSCGKEQTMTIYKEKTDFAECLAYINETIEHVRSLTSIAVSTGGKALDLTNDHKRILRIFARLYRGVNILVSPLGGGLSAAKTIRLEIQDEHAARTSVAVAKLDSIKNLRDEELRYHHCIAPCLAVGGFAHQIKFLRAGAANTGGIFYGFARDYTQTLIDVLRIDPGQAAATVSELRKLEADWQSNAVFRNVTVREIRQSLVGDDSFNTFAASLGFDWQATERTEVRLKWCCQHRDLHGLNVLVRDGDTPILIDYGEVEFSPACLDPLVLELSLLFHPACKTVSEAWPTLAEAANWANLDSFVAGTPLAPFVRACREWAFAVQPVDKGVYATAYAYAVRQLKFPDTDHNLARAIARAAHIALAAG